MNSYIETIQNNKTVFIGIVLAVVALVFSLVFFFSARGFQNQGSYVEVKGLSEKIVKADTAIWTMSFEVKSNNVTSLYAEIEQNLITIKKFLVDKGFEESEINVAPVEIFIRIHTKMLHLDTIPLIKFLYIPKRLTSQSPLPTKHCSGTKGVVLSQNYISFEFSDLNSIKPEMLAEAIKNARDTAGQFARNSGSSVSSVTRGNQGVFDIIKKNPGSPEYKKIRLVSTLRFLLK